MLISLLGCDDACVIICSGGDSVLLNVIHLGYIYIYIYLYIRMEDNV